MTEARKLGQGDVRVGALALGAMAFAGWYDTRDDEGGVLAIHRALDAIVARSSRNSAGPTLQFFAHAVAFCVARGGCDPYRTTSG